MDRIIEQVFSFYFYAIHLPPAEEGEFLLYYVKILFLLIQECPGILKPLVAPVGTHLMYNYISNLFSLSKTSNLCYNTF